MHRNPVQKRPPGHFRSRPVPGREPAEAGHRVRVLDSPGMQATPLNTAGARIRAAIVGVLILPGVLLLAGCAEDRSHLLPGTTVEEISTNLDLVRDLADQDDCLGAIDAAQQVTRQIESLGTAVDARLRRSLREGASRLVLTIQKNCHPSETVTPPADTTLPEIETTGPTGATGTTSGVTGGTGPTGSTNGDDRNSGGEKPENGGTGSGGGGSGGNQGGSGTGGSTGGGSGSTGGGTGTGTGGSTGGGTGTGGSGGDSGGSAGTGTGSGTGGVGPPGG